MKQRRTKHLISVKEVIMQHLMDHRKNWLSSRAITAHLKDELGRDVKPTTYLVRLIKSGHIVRTHKPRHLVNSKNGKQEFIYKWSGRPYRDEIKRIQNLQYDDLPPLDKARLMNCMKAHYPSFPAWYRRIML